ncbi:4-hydroxy-tetrahydrodipicolinate synthase [Bartonella quintana]|uniref:4-hydroxy-tetrahydrodipicolinate synthase n=3 Tax=Bartonella quintana TaxID=803 RepID=DAPA_BARQU|nr:4-hydroxy-tetrahydrodipicolinate synthase [Bartonella quintana]Q6G091.1 RecName: Full=4-hydroxy-tetrahydrodipicolinate synthase; Short=HTPA synthase [Bartonella quintana str. Toulouse]ETS11686.1 dihydrodipicolinate synthase [Bartonella quintana BQ2-D70]ETS14493.1 dihydrodipicolinate synthase [Bartonella quintana JK 73rel]ETS16179.1 dihydrodipicolinate synthase [Bartonella quintana JK 73]ETS18181.1 dihydrodipicolinate synthase [Bartonella quintana JK 7]ETS19010.1 dihydrodipicolinate synthas
MLKGAVTALITPFDDNGAIDEKAFCNFVEWQITQGINGVSPVGTTGESPTLSHEERKQVVELCVEQVAKRVPVVAGAGSNSTSEAVELAQHAEKAGADAILVVTPYYNKPNQKGLYTHFSSIAKAISIPVIIYNIPGRSVIDMAVETMRDLCQDFKNIIGVKDATSKIGRVSEQREKCGKDFIQLSGDDCIALGFNAHGGVGCISVSSNVAPKLCAELHAACFRGDYETALKLNDLLMPLNRAVFIEPSPAGIKYAAAKLGLCGSLVRSPIVPLAETTKKIIDAALHHAGLLKE